MSYQTQSEPNYLRDIFYYVNIKRTFSDSFFVFVNFSNGVMTTPKRRSFLSFFFLLASLKTVHMYSVTAKRELHK